MSELDINLEHIVRWGQLVDLTPLIYRAPFEQAVTILALRYHHQDGGFWSIFEFYLLLATWISNKKNKSQGPELFRQVLERIKEYQKEPVELNVAEMVTVAPEHGRRWRWFRRVRNIFLGAGMASSLGVAAVTSVLGPDHVAEYVNAAGTGDKGSLKNLLKSDIFDTLELGFPDDPLTVGYGAQLFKRVEDGMYVDYKDFLVLNPLSSEEQRHEQIREVLKKYRSHDLEDARWQRFLLTLFPDTNSDQEDGNEAEVYAQLLEIYKDLESQDYVLPEQVAGTSKNLFYWESQSDELVKKILSQIVYTSALRQTEGLDSEMLFSAEQHQAIAWKVWIEFFIDTKYYSTLNQLLRNNSGPLVVEYIDELQEQVLQRVQREFELLNQSSTTIEREDELESSEANMGWFVAMYLDLRGGSRLDAIAALSTWEIPWWVVNQLSAQTTRFTTQAKTELNGVQMIPEDWPVTDDNDFIIFVEYLIGLNGRDFPTIDASVLELCQLASPENPLAILNHFLRYDSIYSVFNKTQIDASRAFDYVGSHSGLTGQDVVFLTHLFSDQSRSFEDSEVDVMVAISRLYNEDNFNNTLMFIYGYAGDDLELLQDIRLALSFESVHGLHPYVQDHVVRLIFDLQRVFSPTQQEIEAVINQVLQINPSNTALQLLTKSLLIENEEYDEWKTVWVGMVTDPDFRLLFSNDDRSNYSLRSALLDSLILNLPKLPPDYDFKRLFRLYQRVLNRNVSIESRYSNPGADTSGFIYHTELAEQLLLNHDFNLVPAVGISYMAGLSNYDLAVEYCNYFFPMEAVARSPQLVIDAFTTFQDLMNQIPDNETQNAVSNLLPNGFSDEAYSVLLLKMLEGSYYTNSVSTTEMLKLSSDSELFQSFSPLQKYLALFVTRFAQDSSDLEVALKLISESEVLKTANNQNLIVYWFGLLYENSYRFEDIPSEFPLVASQFLSTVEGLVQVQNSHNVGTISSSVVSLLVEANYRRLKHAREADLLFRVLELFSNYSDRLKQRGTTVSDRQLLDVVVNGGVLINPLATSIDLLSDVLTPIEVSGQLIGYVPVDLSAVSYLGSGDEFSYQQDVPVFKAPFVFFGPWDGGYLKIGTTQSSDIFLLEEQELLSMFAFGERYVWYQNPDDEHSTIAKLNEIIPEVTFDEIYKLVTNSVFFATPNPVVLGGQVISKTLRGTEKASAEKTIAYISTNDLLYFVQTQTGEEYVVVVPSGVELNDLLAKLSETMLVNNILVQDPSILAELQAFGTLYMSNTNSSGTLAYMRLPTR